MSLLYYMFQSILNTFVVTTPNQPQLNSTELGLTRKLVSTPTIPPQPPTPPPTQTQLPSPGASDQPLMLPKQQHQH